MMFYILTVIGLFVLRIRRPDMERPYRVFGYPLLPGAYLLLALFLEVQLLHYRPQYTWPGLLIVSSGIPIYALWRVARRRASLLEGTIEGAEPNPGSP